ncbi:LOW QUALITY PROTEIN: hypothetical protein HID58_081695 [Brassica napus]|uniref:Kinetochore protein SPC25 n=1 Tax=Brassica napus TaxID=3708 RepID=A0ABQ7Y8J5_BRANA|nr:LOW QUALITY PROTEIN: hypothetical protein HID58_081695 [Brassica napus]
MTIRVHTEVESVSHRDSLRSFLYKSEDLEKKFLTKAIKSYCELQAMKISRRRLHKQRLQKEQEASDFHVSRVVIQRRRLVPLGLMREKDIDEQRLKINSCIASPRSIDSVLDRAKATAQSKLELANMKSNLREAEDELVKCWQLQAHTRLYKVVIFKNIPSLFHSHFSLKDQANIFLLRSSNKDFAVSKDTAGNVTEDNIKDAISWYKQALGFHVEAGHGVKFTFTNIDAERPTREFSFTVHYGNDIYTLVDCNSQLDDLVQELNKTNDHFGFVRQMRDKFQKATLSELPTHSENLPQEISNR